MTTTERRPGPRGALGRLALVLPALACLLCPVCLPAGLGILSALGLGVLGGEGAHLVLTGVSLIVALASGALLTRRHRNPGPVLLTVLGGLAIVAGCMLAEIPALEHAGVVLVMAAVVWGWWLARRPIPALVRIGARPQPRKS